MPQQLVNTEQAGFTPSQLISLFVLDATFLGGDLYHFHAGTNEYFKPIIFNGVEYTPFPIAIDGFDTDGKGGLPRPRISCSNINGFVSNILLQNQNLLGAQFIRRRVFARFLDNENFANNVNPFGTPDPTAAYPDDIFFVNRKIRETREVVEFECTSPLEIDDAKLPRRQILANVCPFRYRDGATCGYGGAPIADKQNKVFGAGGYGFTLSNQGEWNNSTTYNQGDYVYTVSTLPQTYGERIFYVCAINGTVGDTNNPTYNSKNWIADSCPRNLAACKLRFPNSYLRFGGFPGTSRSPIRN